MIDSIPLDNLENGASAQILDLRGRPEQVHRLEELGFRRGTTIHMLQSGSPCIIRVAGTKMCFRRCVNCNILVTPPQPR
jgi:ferrous iron transport protein A